MAETLHACARRRCPWNVDLPVKFNLDDDVVDNILQQAEVTSPRDENRGCRYKEKRRFDFYDISQASEELSKLHLPALPSPPTTT